VTRSIPFSVVTKPTGAACNLDCQYCFFLSKELLYDAAAQTMSEQTLERYVEAFLESSPDGKVTMLWQGGGTRPARAGRPAPRLFLQGGGPELRIGAAREAHGHAGTPCVVASAGRA